MNINKLAIPPKIHHFKDISHRCESSIKRNMILISYIAAFSTIAGGILHLLMVGPTLKPLNFPMEMLPYTDGLFIFSGILQICWAIPMIMNWSHRYHYIGLVGTTGLSLLLLMTRIANPITGLPLEDTNPMALFTEVSQFIYIGTVILVIKYGDCRSRVTIQQRIFNNSKDKFGLEEENVNSIGLNEVFRSSILFNFEKQEDALYLLKKIEHRINVNSHNSKLWITRGIILRKLGSNYEAIESFNEAIKLDPTEASAWYQKGMSLNIIGKREEAKQTYKIANLIAVNTRFK